MVPWHKGSLGYVHPKIFKFANFLRGKQNTAEDKLNNLQAAKDIPNNARYQKNAPLSKKHCPRLPELSSSAQMDSETTLIFLKNRIFTSIKSFFQYFLLIISF